MSGHVSVYVTAANLDEATAIARELVARRLAACVNVLGPVTSIYRWEGEICEDGEVALIAKTRADLVGRVTQAVKARHSYDCPCVVAWPISGGNPDYLAWLDAQLVAREGG